MSRKMSLFSVLLGLALASSACIAAPNAAPDDSFIRFYTDAGSVVEIENPNVQQFPGSASGMATEHRIETRAAKQRFCGELLVNALALVCKGNYKKRTMSSASTELDYPVNYHNKEHFGLEAPVTESGAYWPEFFEVLKNANNPYRGNAGAAAVNELQKAAQSGRAKLRPKRGVVDECCKKPCSTYTLSLYCGA